ncbi:Ca2+-binding protein, EF-hand superfamily [Cohaesibacter sp. ES.047]|uniref:EF-hand domain-containing protein n=1 Tax=Cohaesibacter sp. ES.047 TaxID=1798205 RepID=UPI000BB7D189|nr:EF-hand domain-containing protein [Cohaesibacter sp. ES.047]SNY92109.1 Ca2+-binding protein, EF-hand superfamily [Cohaesibacter sp. ES.047]
MKNLSKITLAIALIGGVSATALTIDNATARGFERGPNMGQGYMGQGFMGHGFKGRGGKGMMGPRGMFMALDADKDGTLTKEELTTGLEAKIKDNDTDGDNAITLEEFKTEWQKITQQAMVRAFQRMDRDGSGKVTLEEIQQPATFMFGRMDRNDDGKIDKSDRPNRGMMNKRGGPRGHHFGPGMGRQFQGNTMGQNNQRGWSQRGCFNQQQSPAPQAPDQTAPDSQN